MENMNITNVASLTIICYLVGDFVKMSKIDNKWIPAIVGLFGLVLGIVGYFFIVDFPANDIFTAAAVGITSGLSATGVNQVFKQFSKEG